MILGRFLWTWPWAIIKHTHNQSITLLEKASKLNSNPPVLESLLKQNPPKNGVGGFSWMPPCCLTPSKTSKTGLFVVITKELCRKEDTRKHIDFSIRESWVSFLTNYLSPLLTTEYKAIIALYCTSLIIIISRLSIQKNTISLQFV